MKKNTTRFQVDSRLAKLLSQEYTSSERALKELVDNAWDADAESVDIHLPEPMSDAPIVIRDDGTGMTSGELERHYLYIAADRRSARGDRTALKQRLGRTPTQLVTLERPVELPAIFPTVPLHEMNNMKEQGGPSLSPSNDYASPSRRDWLRGAGLTAATLAGIGSVHAAPAAAKSGTKAHAKAQLDSQVVVSRARLDSVAATLHDTFNENRVLRSFDPKRHAARFDVELRRITTHTRVPETGETLKVSGLLAIPAGVKGPLPVVSWQHGTILAFDQVPSNLTRVADSSFVMRDNVDSMETLFNVQRLAGNGYAVIAADYIGKGPYRDGRDEAYAVKDATVRTCLDILDAGLAGMRGLGHEPAGLFLNGWSQGAVNTQWLHQELRRQGRKVAGTAVQSPFNELNETFRFWTGVDHYPDPESTPYPASPAWMSLCMVVLLGSYERNYGLKGLMRSATRPEYHQLALKYWKDYDNSFPAGTKLPTASTLLVDGFFDRYTSDVNSAFLRQLAANRATYWNYDAPIRLYYGLADEALHPALVKEALAAGGKNMQGVAVKKASHRVTFLAAMYGEGSEIDGAPDVLTWFDSMRGA